MEVAAIRRNRPVSSPPDGQQILCYPHSRYGLQAYSCRSSRYAMRNQVTPRRPASGNARAGRQYRPSTMSIFEWHSGKYFLIDSGADECVFPASSADRSFPWSSDLIAANGSAIRTYSRRRLPVSFASRYFYFQDFWIAEVSRPILGAAFFRDHHLLIDFCNRRLTSLINPKLHFPTSSLKSLALAVHGLRLPTVGPHESILKEYPSLLKQNFKGEVKHKILHYIPTTGLLGTDTCYKQSMDLN